MIARMEALCRLLEQSGDLTPMGTRQILAVVRDEERRDRPRIGKAVL